MQAIQDSILSYIDDNRESSTKYSRIIKLFDKFKIRSNKSDLGLILHMILYISSNHFHGPNFFEKIDKILYNLKNDIYTNFTNKEIFKICMMNNRILLFLIKEKIVIIDNDLTQLLMEYYDYEEIAYFYKEIKPFISTQNYQSILNDYKVKDIKDFEANRMIGENEKYICKLIRNDSIDKFIQLFRQKNYSYDTDIDKYDKSIFETNQMLKGKDFKIIQYAAFSGAIKIFKFLLNSKNIELEPTIWKYAIHGRNLEIIHLLEKTNVPKPEYSYNKFVKKAIKCFHNDIAEYFDKSLNDSKGLTHFTSECIKFRNFSFMHDIQLCIKY